MDSLSTWFGNTGLGDDNVNYKENTVTYKAKVVDPNDPSKTRIEDRVVTYKDQIPKKDENKPLTAYSFVLRVEALYDIPLKSVSAFTKENEYDVIREGGVNDYVHLRRKGVTKPFSFTVERYAGIRPITDPLPNGAELILPVLLFVYRGEEDVTKLNAIKRVYVFTGCNVQSIQYGALDSERSTLLTDKITINYRELICIEIPGR